jgi:hypothetical protein
MKLLTIAQVTSFSLSLGDQRHKWGGTWTNPNFRSRMATAAASLFAECKKVNSSMQPKRLSATLAQCLLKRRFVCGTRSSRTAVVENDVGQGTVTSGPPL